MLACPVCFEYSTTLPVSHIELKRIDMSLRFLIPFVSAALFASPLFAQDKSQPTVDELVAKNIEAKGGATALPVLGPCGLVANCWCR